MLQSIQGRMARGATWMLAFRLADRALAFVSTIILARVLVPADFGLVAMATSVIALIELISAFSLEVGLIQRANPGRAEYDTTWTLRLLMAAAVGAVTAALALPAADFYSDPRIAPLLWVLAANLVVGGLENIGVVDFRRALDFRREFLFMMSRRAAAMPVTLTLAVVFNTYWALVIGVCAGTLCGVVVSYLMHPYRPRPSLACWRALLSFSAWLLVFNLLSFLQSRLSHFILGREHGAAELGFFTVATDTAALASNEITAPINRAVMPGLSRLNEQAGGLGPGLLRVTATVLLVTLPAAFGMAAVAEPLVLSLLGSQWMAAVPVLQVLAFAGALQSVTANNHSAYLASARTHVPVIIATAFVLTLVPAMFVLMPYGAVGMAFANLIGSAVTLGVSVGLMKRYLGTTPAGILRVAWRPLLAALLMGAAVHGLDRVNFGLADALPPLPRLALGVAAGIVLYVPLVLALWAVSGRPDGGERIVLDLVRARLQRTAGARN